VSLIKWRKESADDVDMATYYGDEIDLDNPGQVKLAAIAGMIAIPMFILIGLYILGSSVMEALDCQKARDWPVTQGVVVRSDLDSETSITNRRAIETTTYDVNIRYVYRVDGAEHTGDQVTLGAINRNSEKTAYRLLNDYPQGATVAVHYDPLVPSRAVLDTEVPMGTKLGIGGGAVASLIGVGLLFVAFGGGKDSEHESDEVERIADEPTGRGAMYGRPI